MLAAAHRGPGTCGFRAAGAGERRRYRVKVGAERQEGRRAVAERAVDCVGPSAASGSCVVRPGRAWPPRGSSRACGCAVCSAPPPGFAHVGAGALPAPAAGGAASPAPHTVCSSGLTWGLPSSPLAGTLGLGSRVCEQLCFQPPSFPPAPALPPCPPPISPASCPSAFLRAHLSAHLPAPSAVTAMPPVGEVNNRHLFSQKQIHQYI